MRVRRVFIAGALVGLAAGVVVAGLVGRGDSAPSAERPRGGGPGGGQGGGQGAPLPAITTAALAPTAVERTLEAVGSGRAAKSVTLVSEATGLVETVAIRSGEAVKAGDVILKLEDAEQRIAVRRAQAQFPVAKANNDRYAALYKDDSASKLEADEAYNAYKAVEADLRAAEFALGQRTIKAPFDGIVGLTSIEAGDYVRAGDVVTTIDDPSALIIEFTAPQEAASFVEIGQPITAALAGGTGEPISGAVSAIDSRIDAASRTLRIEATVSDRAAPLLPGATYAVKTTNAGAPALAAPGLAVQWDRTGAYVWRLAADGSASRASVTILQRRDDVAVIEGEVKAGDLVIVEGADRVRPGMVFKDAASAALAPAGSAAGAR